MRFSHRSLAPALVAVGALLSLFSLSAHAQTGYIFRGLGGLGVDINRHVSIDTNQHFAINNKGLVAGNSEQYSPSHTDLGVAASLFRNGNIVNLGNFGTDSNGTGFSYATGINDNGQIAGWAQAFNAQNSSQGNVAFFWQNGTFTNLGNLGTDTGGSGYSYATGINAQGQVVGWSQSFNAQHLFPSDNAFLWQSSKGLTNLGNLGSFGTNGSGQTFSYAYAINSSSQVVGYTQVFDSNHANKGFAALLWQNSNTAPTNLGNLGTDNGGGAYSMAYGINAPGQVVGASSSFDTNHNSMGNRAFLWQNNQMMALPALGTDTSGMTYAQANGINDKGQIVGQSNRYGSGGNFIERDAVLWPNANTVVNLNDYLPAGSGWFLMDAYAINNRGQITGYGMHNGAKEPFLLTPYVAGDFTRDGSPDILFQNSQTGDMGLAIMFGTTHLNSIAPANGVSLDWKVVATPDLNGDGYADLVWQNTKTGDIAFWLLNNGRFLDYGYIYNGLPLNWKVVGSADFNGDGYTDLVLQDSQTGNIAVWYLTGTDYYAYGFISQSPGTGWQVVGAGDMNGDGQPDLLLRSKANGDLYAWELNGLTVSKGVLIANVPLEWNMVGLGDFGGDGNVSLLWQNSKTNDLYYWLMNGTTQTGNGLIQSGVPNWQVVGPK